MTVGLRCGSRTRGISWISPSRAVAGLVDFSRNVVSMMYSRLCHLAVSIEADIAAVVSTLVGHEHRWTVIVETASVVVRVHCERPATGLPSYRAIEVGECHILVELPAVQDIAEVSVTAILPDAEDISVSVQAHQVVEVDLVDCLILCSGEVELVSQGPTPRHSLVLWYPCQRGRGLRSLLRYSSLRSWTSQAA